MHTRFALVLLVIVGCATFGASPAQAQYGCQGGWGAGFGAWDVGRLYRVLAQNVPYYAAFPPVYYSAPVPRTYGYSPFAYPPGAATPELVDAPAALEISNPFVKPAATGKQGDQITAAPAAKNGGVQPLLVINPYVDEAQDLAAVAPNAGNDFVGSIGGPVIPAQAGIQ